MGAAGPDEGRVWPPVDLPMGYHTAPREQSNTRPSLVASRAAPGTPRGQAKPGRREATRAPARKIIRDGQAAEGIAISGHAAARPDTANTMTNTDNATELAPREATTGKIDAWAVAGPLDVREH
jgi:hypothetical protein